LIAGHAVAVQPLPFPPLTPIKLQAEPCTLLLHRPPRPPSSLRRPPLSSRSTGHHLLCFPVAVLHLCHCTAARSQEEHHATTNLACRFTVSLACWNKPPQLQAPPHQDEAPLPKLEAAWRWSPTGHVTGQDAAVRPSGQIPAASVFCHPWWWGPRQHVRGMSPPPELLRVSSPCLYIISFIPSMSQCLLSPWSISSGRDTRWNFWEVAVRLKLVAAMHVWSVMVSV
jgi:hypothetical protein